MSNAGFILGLAGLAAAVAAILIGTRAAGLWWCDRPYPPDLATLIQKEELAERMAGPRVFLVGGSNVLFSTDSMTLSRELAVPVVDMGFSGLLGLAFMLHQVDRHARAGDTVMLIPEYWQFLGGAYGDGQFLADAVIVHPAWLFDLTAPAQWRRLADGLGTFDHRLVARARHHVRTSYRYLPEGFNAHGDEVRHWMLPDGTLAEKLAGGIPPGCAYDPAGTSLVNAFAARSAARGVRAAFVWSVFARPEFDRHRALIGELEASLRASLRVPVLDRPEDGVFPVDQLFDSVNHLNARGVPVRTRHLARVIGRFLKDGH